MSGRTSEETQNIDADLVRRSQMGDLTAFNAIVLRYQALVFNVSARILGNYSVAEDVSQETFISAHKSISGFRGGSLKSWLLRIASNLSYDYLRSQRRKPELSLDEPSVSDPESSIGDTIADTSGSTSPEEQALKSELRAEIQRIILSLPFDQRTVLVLIDVQGFSYEEAAQTTVSSVGTVKSRLSRARAKFRECMANKRELFPI